MIDKADIMACLVLHGWPLNEWRILGRGKKEYEPPRYMSINTAIEQLLEVEESRAEKGSFQFFCFVFLH